jgi:hypothetical protein
MAKQSVASNGLPQPELGNELILYGLGVSGIKKEQLEKNIPPRLALWESLS